MLRFRPILTSLVLAVSAAAWLVGCNSSPTGPASPVGSGPELPLGEYSVLYTSEENYDYDEYFVVRPDHHWEYVKYGYVPATNNLCELTRQRGIYISTDSTLTLTGLWGGPTNVKCGMTKTDFDAYPFQAETAHTKQVFQIRNITATSFDANNLFVTWAGWSTYEPRPDPYGFL